FHGRTSRRPSPPASGMPSSTIAKKTSASYRTMRNRTVLKLFGIIAPILTWIFAFLWPGRKASVAAAECANKSKIMALVQNLESYMDPEGKTPLQSIVEKCYALGSFPALWAVEGAGKDLAEVNMALNENPVGLLTNAQLDPKWDGAWLMLHAGIGLGFAKHYMDRLKPNFTDADIQHVMRRTVDLCRANSRPGYYFAGSPGFFNGVISTVVMRYDTTPDDPLIQQFLNHKPNPNNRTLCGLWNSKIKGSLRTALESIYPVLKKHQHLDQVFKYQSLPALAARLERGEAV